MWHNFFSPRYILRIRIGEKFDMITFDNIIIINIKSLDNGIIEAALLPDNFQILLLDNRCKIKGHVMLHVGNKWCNAVTVSNKYSEKLF